MKKAASAIHNSSVWIRVNGEDLLDERVEGQPARAKVGAIVGRIGRTNVHVSRLPTAGISEDAGLEGCGGHNAGFQERCAKPPDVFVNEEEGLVFLNGSSKRIAHLVAHERILMAVPGKKVFGGKRGVAPEPVNIGVKIVGALLGDNVDDGAVVAAKLRLIVVSDRAECLRSLRI